MATTVTSGFRRSAKLHMNSIPQKQNERNQIERLCAQRSLYSRAKIVVGLQFTLAIVPALAFAILMLKWPGLKVFATLTSLAITLLDFGLLDPIQKAWRKTAAQIQEAFDCDVLDLDWTVLRAGKQPPPEDVMRYARGAMAKPEEVTAVRDWYPKSVGELPIELGRLLCQRTNCHWDATLRAAYSFTITISLWFVAIAVFVCGAIANPTFDGFVLAMLAPATPAMVLALRQHREHSDASRSSVQLREHVDGLWTKTLSKEAELSSLTAESRAVQSEIFLRRAMSSPVFDWLYNLVKKRQQEFADRSTDHLVAEAKRALSI